jgi:hypothetical protein
MSKYETTHLSPSEIDRLRLKAFVTNSQEDLAAYYRAASLYFQERDVRAMNRAARIEELEAKLAKAVEALEWVKFGGGPRGEGYHEFARTTLAELKGQDDE